MRRMYNKFKKPYVGIWLFWRPALIINSPEIGRNILMKDSALFRNRFIRSGNSDPIGQLNLFSLDVSIINLLLYLSFVVLFLFYYFIINLYSSTLVHFKNRIGFLVISNRMMLLNRNQNNGF